MTTELQAVQDSARMRQAISGDFLDAVRAARAAGHSLAEIAAAAGMTRQAIHHRLRKQEKEVQSWTKKS